MGIRQVDEEDWKEVYAPTTICQLAITVRELEEKYGFKRFEYCEDGIGQFEALVFEIEGSLYWVATNQYDDLKDMSEISCRSYEPDTKNAYEKLVSELGIKSCQIIWVNDSLGPAKWALIRVDDNANEITMFQFQSDSAATYVQKVYEKRGHKQAYFVRAAT